MKFHEFIEEWKLSRLKCSKGWMLCQDQIIKDHILPILYSFDLEEIKPAHISLILVASKNKGHSENQTKKIYMVLSKIFGDAIHLFELINKNPIKKQYHSPSVKQVERPHLTKLQSWAFLEYVMHEELFGIAVWIQMLSGLRVSEAQGLEWSDIDFEKDVIHVKRKFNRLTNEMDPYTKNGTFHTAILSPALKRFLLEKKQSSGFICKRQSGGMMSYNGYKQFLLRVCKDMKLPIRSSHGLRHSFAKLLEEEGASDEIIQKALNHKTIQSTRTYIHRTDEKLREIIKKLA